MIVQPGSLISRLLALSLLAGVAALAYGGLVLPAWQHWQAGAAQIEQSRQQLIRLRRLVASEPALAAALEEARASATRSGGYLSGESEALIAAQLQDLATAIIDGAGARPKSVQSLASRKSEADLGMTAAGVKLQFAATTASLAQMLYAVERHEPRLFVDRLTVVLEAGRTTRRAKMSDVLLDVELELFGYFEITPLKGGEDAEGGDSSNRAAASLAGRGES